MSKQANLRRKTKIEQALPEEKLRELWGNGEKSIFQLAKEVGQSCGNLKKLLFLIFLII